LICEKDKKNIENEGGEEFLTKNKGTLMFNIAPPTIAVTYATMIPV
jgi:hypothetical protein